MNWVFFVTFSKIEISRKYNFESCTVHYKIEINYTSYGSNIWRKKKTAIVTQQKFTLCKTITNKTEMKITNISHQPVILKWKMIFFSMHDTGLFGSIDWMNVLLYHICHFPYFQPCHRYSSILVDDIKNSQHVS